MLHRDWLIPRHFSPLGYLLEELSFRTHGSLVGTIGFGSPKERNANGRVAVGRWFEFENDRQNAKLILC